MEININAKKATQSQLEKLKGVRLFVCISGAGKTYLESQAPNKFVDHDRLRDCFQLGLPEDTPAQVVTQRQAECNIEAKNGVEEYAHKKLMEDYKDGSRIILTAPVPYVMESIEKEKIPYIRVTYNQKDPVLNQEFRKRRLGRGSPEAFVDWIEEAMIHFNEEWLNDPNAAAVIKFGQNDYLIDVINTIHGQKQAQDKAEEFCQ